MNEVEVSKGNIGLGTEIKDGPTNDWPAATVSKVIEHYRERWSIDSIVTFDSVGVSGHQNHKHTHRGVVAHRAEHKDRLGLSYWYLHTAPIYVKYSSWLAVWYYSLVADNSTIFINKNEELVWASMRAHESQLVWFRRLYLLFTSYVYVNQFTKC